MMKALTILGLMLLFSIASFCQSKPQLEFKDKTLSPSQAIYRELLTVYKDIVSARHESPLDSVCIFNLSTIKFTVAADGTISGIVPSVSMPDKLLELLSRSIMGTQGRWVNHKGNPIDCFVPLIIIPARSCPEERPFEILPSGAQMLKYQGEYTKFAIPNFNDYNKDMVEGVIISPLFLWSSGTN